MTDTPWRNRIVGHGDEAPDQLLSNPLNWRLHPAVQQATVRGLLEELGTIQSVIVNQRSGFLIDGHLRVQLALRSGQPTIPVTYVDLSEEEEALALATLDSSTGLAIPDGDQLQAVIDQAKAESEAVQRYLGDLPNEAALALAAQVGGSSSSSSSSSRKPLGRSDEATVKVVLSMPSVAVFEEALAATGEERRGHALLMICSHYLKTNGQG